MRYFLFAVIMSVLLSTSIAMGAVESIGEINVIDDPSGQVPASAKVPLLITLTVDRSRAVPVTEDIKTFEIVFPNQFSIQALDVKKILLDRIEKPRFTVEVTGNSVWISLENPITDTKANRVVEIEFLAGTPDIVMPSARFGVRMRNPMDVIIGEFIRAGNADQKVNNDDFTLEVIPNVPPPPPAVLEAQAIPNENNVRLNWEMVPDLGDSGGYFIYRDSERIENLNTPTASSFLDVNVPPGPHTYSIEAYKTSLLRSIPLDSGRVNVDQDTTAPEPPRDFSVELEANRVLLSWRSSVSLDVVLYRVEFQAPDDAQEIIAEVLPTESAEDGKFGVIHSVTLRTGVSVYRVFAIDEANQTSYVTEEIRLFDKPFPNPFTPLSDDPRFNQITFRTTRESDASFRVRVFDLHATLVWSLTADTGKNELRWDGHDDDGELVSSGIYVYQMLLGDEVVGSGTVIVAK